MSYNAERFTHLLWRVRVRNLTEANRRLKAQLRATRRQRDTNWDEVQAVADRMHRAAVGGHDD